ncbi:MAG: YkvA family protein, partial [bacterium]
MKRSVMRVIRQIPSYLRLLAGLIGDRRVSRVDRLLVIGALAYIVSPLDFIPDLVPFLGEVDDVFLLMLALQRMVERAGIRVLRDHWRGDPAELDDLIGHRHVTGLRVAVSRLPHAAHIDHGFAAGQLVAVADFRGIE